MRGAPPHRLGAVWPLHRRRLHLGLERRECLRHGFHRRRDRLAPESLSDSGERTDRQSKSEAESRLPGSIALRGTAWLFTTAPSLRRRGRGALAAILTWAAACSGGYTAPRITGNPPPPRPTLSPTYRPSGHMAVGDVFVHLFEWKWTDVATECEQVLGPAGFTAVQISPPQEHSVQPPSYPWSERYQPVSYSIARSRSGTDAEFAAMVQRCHVVGVGIYVDAVINHMTNYPSPGVGSNGTAYTKYSYPGLYTPSDFHTACTVSTYQDAANVQDCELFGLPDLNTGLPSVRQKIAGYLSCWRAWVSRASASMRRSTSSRWSSTTFSRSSTPRSRRTDGRSRITSWRSAACGVMPCRRAITSAKRTARAAQPTSPSSRSWASATNSAASGDSISPS